MNHSLQTLNPDSQRNLILQAIRGDRVLSALNAYTMTMETILNSKTSVQISVLRKTEEKNVLMFVAALVKEYSKTVRTVWGSDDSDRNTQDKYIDVAVQMMNEFWMWKLEEFAVFFRNAMRGIYTRPMGNVDMECLFIMGEQYSTIRAEYLSQQAHNKIFDRDEIKRESDIDDATIKKIFKEINSKLTTYTPTNFQTEKNDLCQTILKEFDLKYRNEKKDDNGSQRFITHDGKQISESEYLETEFKKRWKKK